MRRLLLAFPFLLNPTPSIAQLDASPIVIQRVTPAGDDVSASDSEARQIVIQFDRAVVPVGEMARSSSEIPVVVEPKTECAWRWLNTSALACQLGEKQALLPSTRYRVTVNPGIRAEDGQTIAETYRHEFTTERPKITGTSFDRWRSPDLPRIRITFNQPVTGDSLAEHLYFARLSEPSQPVSGEESEEAATAEIAGTPHVRLKIEPAGKRDRDRPFWLRFKEGAAGLFEPKKADDDLVMVDGREARRHWIVEPVEELAPDARYALKSEAGIVPAAGTEKSAADDAIVALATFPEFAFLGVECDDSKNERYRAIRFTPGQANEGLRCDPLAATTLIFTAPVLRADAKRALRFEPDLAGGRTDYDPWGVTEDEDVDESAYEGSHVKGREYRIWLPYGLKTMRDYHITERDDGWWQRLLGFFGQGERGFEDAFGRRLNIPLDIVFRTDHRRPNYELEYSNAVLEKGIDSEVPLYVDNLKSFGLDFTRLRSTGRDSSTLLRQVPQVPDIQFAVPLGIREAVGAGSGAVFGTLTTDPVVSPTPPSLFAQVSPWNVQVKLGHFGSLAWVSDFATGKPVPGVAISLYSDSLTALAGPVKPLAAATTDDSGIALLPGTDTLDPALTLAPRWSWKDSDDQRLFALARKADDQALIALDRSSAVDLYAASGESISEAVATRYGHMHAWGFTAQGIYRAGDTVEYEFFVRQQDNRRFVVAPKDGYRLEILDPTGKTVHEEDNIALSEFGAHAGSFAVPKDGAVGWYEFKLKGSFEKAGEKDEPLAFESTPLRVLVADFTPAPFKVTTELNGTRFGPGAEIDVATAARLHAGGPYANGPLRLTATLAEQPFTTKNPAARDFIFDGRSEEPNQIWQTEGNVDEKGDDHTKFTLPGQTVAYGRLTVESAVADERGKNVASRATAEYAGVSRFVGLRSKDWMYPAGKPVSLDFLVVGPDGAPVGGSPVTVTYEVQKTDAARVKGAGNAYLTDYTTSWVRAGGCERVATTAAQACAFTPDKPGSYRTIATVTDPAGGKHSTELSLWVTGPGYVQWNSGDTNRLELVPNQTGYHVGDTAKFLVKNPFPGASALVSVERYGILDHFVTTLEGSTPTIEIPIKPDYLPGAYVSVTVFSPRVDKPFGKVGEVDLGKPAFRLGYAELPVSDPYKQLTVTAKAGQDVYRPRDTVEATLHAEPKKTGQGDAKEPVQFAIVALDEAVFDLNSAGRKYYDPYDGFYTLDGLDVRNFNLMLQLIGRQKFEKKGATPGGDGGAALAMRNLFKFVAYWNPALKADANGDAKISFTVPDNLTGWRIFALALTPTDRMGLGEASFKVNRPTEIRPAMPNQVMEGDRFTAAFSVMNRTDAPRTLKVTLDAEGDLSADAKPHHETSVTLKPFERKLVELPLHVGKVEMTREKPGGEIRFTAEAGDAADADSIAHTLNVKKWRSFDVGATYGTSETSTEENVLVPKTAKPDVGEIGVVVSSSVIGNLAGAFQYVRDYLYLCWEQRLTKAVMAARYVELKPYLPDTLKWNEAKDLPTRMLGDAGAFQAPNGGMAYFVATDEHADPYLSAFTALAFDWLEAGGYAIPEAVETKLHKYLDSLLKKDVLPSFYDDGMASSVRAVALDALARRGKAEPSDLDRYLPSVPKMDLFGKAHLLSAAAALDVPLEKSKPVFDAILAKSNQTGGKLVFTEKLDDGYARILSSPLRSECAILESLTAYGETATGKPLVGDLPMKLARQIAQSRGARDHWDNTQENLFCLNALAAYARVYEKTAPAMTLKATIDGAAIGEAKLTGKRDPAVTLSRPIAADDLGVKRTLAIAKEGVGRYYYSARVRYALDSKHSTETNAGIEVKREYEVERDGKFILLKPDMSIRKGELVKVDLFVSLPAARNFVVVDDPVPGGLEPVNRDLATASTVDADKGEFERDDNSFFFRFKDWEGYDATGWNFYHRELKFDAARFYADYLPAGHYHLSYTAQAVADGEFAVLPATASEMYDPDTYGKTPAAKLTVQTPAP